MYANLYNILTQKGAHRADVPGDGGAWRATPCWPTPAQFAHPDPLYTGSARTPTRTSCTGWGPSTTSAVDQPKKLLFTGPPPGAALRAYHDEIHPLVTTLAAGASTLALCGEPPVKYWVMGGTPGARGRLAVCPDPVDQVLPCSAGSAEAPKRDAAAATRRLRRRCAARRWMVSRLAATSGPAARGRAGRGPISLTFPPRSTRTTPLRIVVLSGRRPRQSSHVREGRTARLPADLQRAGADPGDWLQGVYPGVGRAAVPPAPPGGPSPADPRDSMAVEPGAIVGTRCRSWLTANQFKAGHGLPGHHQRRPRPTGPAR